MPEGLAPLPEPRALEPSIGQARLAPGPVGAARFGGESMADVEGIVESMPDRAANMSANEIAGSRRLQQNRLASEVWREVAVRSAYVSPTGCLSLGHRKTV